MPDPPERTESGERATQLILQSFQFHGLLTAAGDELTKPWGLSTAKWKVLGAIAQANGPLHVAQIGRNMGLARQAVQRTVNALEQAGFVELVDNPDHQRARLVQHTAKGKAAYLKVMAEQILWSNELAEGLSKRAIETAIKVVATLSERLKQEH